MMVVTGKTGAHPNRNNNNVHSMLDLHVAHGSAKRFERSCVRRFSPKVRKTPPAKQLRAARNQPSKMGSCSFKKNGINSPCMYHYC